MDTSTNTFASGASSIADAIKKARFRMGLTLEQLAIRANLSKSAIHQYESERTLPSAKAIKLLAVALGESEEVLLNLRKISVVDAAIHNIEMEIASVSGQNLWVISKNPVEFNDLNTRKLTGQALIGGFQRYFFLPESIQGGQQAVGFYQWLDRFITESQTEEEHAVVMSRLRFFTAPSSLCNFSIAITNPKFEYFRLAADEVTLRSNSPTATVNQRVSLNGLMKEEFLLSLMDDFAEFRFEIMDPDFAPVAQNRFFKCIKFTST